jgi:hypothetical protein
MTMEEDWILERFHQQVKKSREKSWHDKHIKKKNFKEGDLVLMYDSKSIQHPGKLRMHWLGPYEVKTVTDRGDERLRRCRNHRDDQPESQMKLYKDIQPPTT